MFTQFSYSYNFHFKNILHFSGASGYPANQDGFLTTLQIPTDIIKTESNRPDTEIPETTTVIRFQSVEIDRNSSEPKTYFVNKEQEKSLLTAKGFSEMEPTEIFYQSLTESGTTGEMKSEPAVFVTESTVQIKKIGSLEMENFEGKTTEYIELEINTPFNEQSTENEAKNLMDFPTTETFQLAGMETANPSVEPLEPSMTNNFSTESNKIFKAKPSTALLPQIVEKTSVEMLEAEPIEIPTETSILPEILVSKPSDRTGPAMNKPWYRNHKNFNRRPQNCHNHQIGADQGSEHWTPGGRNQVLWSPVQLFDAFRCIGSGLFQHPTDCDKFLHCNWAGQLPFLLSCGPTTYWDDVHKQCGWSCVRS